MEWFDMQAPDNELKDQPKSFSAFNSGTVSSIHSFVFPFEIKKRFLFFCKDYLASRRVEGDELDWDEWILYTHVMHARSIVCTPYEKGGKDCDTVQYSVGGHGQRLSNCMILGMFPPPPPFSSFWCWLFYSYTKHDSWSCQATHNSYTTRERRHVGPPIWRQQTWQ